MNSMTDREMLELAAKAAGYQVVRWTDDNTALLLYGVETPWNPRDDDGDAFGLMVDLKLEPRFIDNSHSNGVEPSRVTLHNISGIVEKHGADRYAATRRAITRAAAEIGRNMT